MRHGERELEQEGRDEGEAPERKILLTKICKGRPFFKKLATKLRTD